MFQGLATPSVSKSNRCNPSLSFCAILLRTRQVLKVGWSGLLDGCAERKLSRRYNATLFFTWKTNSFREWRWCGWVWITLRGDVVWWDQLSLSKGLHWAAIKKEAIIECVRVCHLTLNKQNHSDEWTCCGIRVWYACRIGFILRAKRGGFPWTHPVH